MKFTGKMVGVKLDMVAYQKKLDDYLTLKLHEVAKAWLRGVTGRVPVWSGMARGSLLSLVDLINGSLLITPKSGVPSRIPEGELLGSAVPEYGPTDYKITISTKVPHYVTQEYKNVGVSKSAPWLSFAAGLIAASEVSKKVKLPQPVFQAVKIKGF